MWYSYRNLSSLRYELLSLRNSEVGFQVGLTNVRDFIFCYRIAFQILGMQTDFLCSLRHTKYAGNTAVGDLVNAESGLSNSVYRLKKLKLG